MSSLIIKGDTSGAITLSAPNAAGDSTYTLPAVNGSVMVSGNMPAFSVYNNTGQSVSTSTTTKLTFNTEEWDTNNNFASSTFTPTVAGYYTFASNIGFQASNSYGVLVLYKNGSASRSSPFIGLGRTTRHGTAGAGQWHGGRPH